MNQVKEIMSEQEPQLPYKQSKKLCPSCGQPAVFTQGHGGIFWTLFVLCLLFCFPVAILMLFIRHKKTCLNCRFTWK